MASKGETLYLRGLVCFLVLTGLAYSESDTLLQGQRLKYGGQLVSAFGTFRLGFFIREGKIYIGIFYNYSRDNYDFRRSRYYRNNYVNEPVWVANLNRPIPDESGVLTIGSDGNLKILHSSGNPSVLSSAHVSGNTCATLLDNGNLVLNELNSHGSVKRLLWQSFDYPTDTLLPGMKLGINLRSGHTWSLKSGSFSLELDPNRKNQMIIWWAGDVYWTSGEWLNGRFNLSNELSNKRFRFRYVSNDEEKYFMYEVDGDSMSTPPSTPMLTLSNNGNLLDPTHLISIYCGGNTDEDWGDPTYAHSAGCVYKDSNACKKDIHEFLLKRGLISGNVFKYNESYHLGLEECNVKCERNCSCVAYAPTDETTKSGCQIWSNITVETSVQENQQSAYVIVYAPLVQEHKGDSVKWFVWLLVAIGGAAVLTLLCFMVFATWRRYNEYLKVKCLALQTAAMHAARSCNKKLKQLFQSLKKYDTEEEILLEELGIDTKQSPGRPGRGRNELQFLSFESIALATNNFTSEDKLGEGGFGPVYKGKLPDGQEVAIKRLSRNSKQGLAEFKNEVKVIAKLQHNNLVRLVGCCIEKEEKMLIYEYMPNKSLDYFLFDAENQEILDWRKRFNIIEGISQGLLYLHKYSRLKIIHRDLKASNILLDGEMNPKISDFGMAKIFGPDETKANTIRVVGTYGYISPEYAIDGLFSTKSDVFSFGVLLLEIVAGRKNSSFHYSDSHLSLTAYAWDLWKEGKERDLIDPVLGESVNQNEASRCIHVGLLCVQENPTDRPVMLDVISMLYNEAYQLPPPNDPAFYYRRNFAAGTSIAEQNQVHITVNDVSITEMEAR